MYTTISNCSLISRAILVILLVILPAAILHAQDITESNYLKQDSILWTEYEQKQGALRKLWKEQPDKEDSIINIYKRLSEETSKKNRELAIQYASVPSGLQRLYMVRLDLPKDTISTVFNTLSSDIKESLYGKNILAHLQTKQLMEGDIILPFDCVQDDGEEFKWGVAHGKQLLILYGGLDCMGEEGRNYLQHLYENTSRDNFLIIVYCPVSSLQNLKRMKEKYPFDYLFISDFKEDASPIKIKYGSQARPTCFLTNKNHIILAKFIGIEPELINKYVVNQSYDSK